MHLAKALESLTALGVKFDRLYILDHGPTPQVGTEIEPGSEAAGRIEKSI